VVSICAFVNTSRVRFIFALACTVSGIISCSSGKASEYYGIRNRSASSPCRWVQTRITEWHFDGGAGGNDVAPRVGAHSAPRIGKWSTSPAGILVERHPPSGGAAGTHTEGERPCVCGSQSILVAEWSWIGIQYRGSAIKPGLTRAPAGRLEAAAIGHRRPGVYDGPSSAVCHKSHCFGSRLENYIGRPVPTNAALKSQCRRFSGFARVRVSPSEGLPPGKLTLLR